MTAEQIKELKKGQFVRPTIGSKLVYEVTEINDFRVSLLRTKPDSYGRMVDVRMSPPIENMRDFELVK